MSFVSAINADRLQGFLRQAKPLLRGGVASHPAQRQKASLAPDRLRACLSAVSLSLTATRRAGAFANPWTVGGLKRDEVRTTAVLAWLLDPQGSHGGGDHFARAIWDEAMGNSAPFPLDGLRRSKTEITPLGDEGSRVDLVLEGDEFLVFIEAKIGAQLRPNQLSDYRRLLHQRADMLEKTHRQLILLSVHDLRDIDDCGWLAWRSVGRAIRRVVRDAEPTYGMQLAASFAEHLLKRSGTP